MEDGGYKRRHCQFNYHIEGLGSHSWEVKGIGIRLLVLHHSEHLCYGVGGGFGHYPSRPIDWGTSQDFSPLASQTVVRQEHRARRRKLRPQDICGHLLC